MTETVTILRSYAYRLARGLHALSLLAVSACSQSIAVVSGDGLNQRVGSPAFDHLSASYNNASSHQARISQATELSSSSEAQQAFRQMVIDGFSMVDANCSDFFHREGQRQQWLVFTRDVVGAAGTLVTAISAATGAPTGLVTSFSIATATGYNGLDIYQRNFLFGADNIDSVRVLVSRTMAARRTAVLGDKTPWEDFGEAQTAIMQYQEECMPATILSDSRTAIKTATAMPELSNDNVSDPGSHNPTRKHVTVSINAPPLNPKDTALAGGQSAQSSQARVHIKPISPKTPQDRTISVREKALFDYVRVVAGKTKPGSLAQSDLRKIAEAVGAPVINEGDGAIATQRGNIIVSVDEAVRTLPVPDANKKLDAFVKALKDKGLTPPAI